MSECLLGLKPYVSNADCLLTGYSLAVGIAVTLFLFVTFSSIAIGWHAYRGRKAGR